MRIQRALDELDQRDEEPLPGFVDALEHSGFQRVDRAVRGRYPDRTTDCEIHGSTSCGCLTPFSAAGIVPVDPLFQRARSPTYPTEDLLLPCNAAVTGGEVGRNDYLTTVYQEANVLAGPETDRSLFLGHLSRIVGSGVGNSET